MNVSVLSKPSRIACAHDMTSSAELRGPRHACTCGVMTCKNLQNYWPLVWGFLRLWVDFPHKRPVIRTFDVFFFVRLGKVSNCLWFETLWCLCYAVGSTKHEISHSRHSGQQRRHLVCRVGTRIDHVLARYGMFTGAFHQGDVLSPMCFPN